ncbi:MAG: carboxypeptidase-like regulatory domain-containing protein [Bacteroidales bacterium]|nr:carboxypeptidase-like regulatory domain-containing protein [Bacteroidales bacterium]
MKRNLVSLIAALMACCLSLFAQSGPGYISVTGKVIDAKTKFPVDYASVSLSGTGISNITNSEGVFTLKIPSSGTSGKKITVTHLGYAALIIDVDELASASSSTPKKLEMIPVSLKIDAALVKAMNARDLIDAAYSRVKYNYPQKKMGMTAFYRELIRKGNTRYLSLNEAIIDINKAPYRMNNADRAGIYKGRGSTNYNSTDSLLVQYQGGVISSLDIDQVQNPFAGVYYSDIDKYYDFTMGESHIMDNKVFYVVNFNQKDTQGEPLFRGSVFIDSETFAIGRVEMNMNVEGNPLATNIFVKKKPHKSKVEVTSAGYIINYKQLDDLWYYDYAMIDIRFTARGRFSLFKTNYSIVSEMAITDRGDKEKDINSDNRMRFSDQLAKRVADFTDDNFWEDYNIIEPDQSVEVIIKKIVRQLKRRESN